MNQELTLAFIGGGNMANALASGLIGKRCAASKVHVVDPHEDTRQKWDEKGCSTAAQADAALSGQRVWVLAVKPQNMREVAQQCRPYLHPDTLVISIAAGITSQTLGQWLGGDKPWTRLVRCMPNTPALIGAGITGLLAGPQVDEQDKAVTELLFKSVGQFAWFENDDQLDAVTAVSGSGPAYVFLFIEALIQGATQLGLSPEQARKLALATVAGATELAALSPDSPATLRERVTSKGGTTAAALQVFEQQGWAATVQAAMQAAYVRAGQLAAESAQQ